jgi:predicted nucleic acid-binding Zn finger protein
MSDQREELKAKLPEFSKYGAKLDRAIDAVLAGGVKDVRFFPSGRRLFAVVGRLGDEFIDPDKPYCSCGNFYFRVLGGREDICYHLLSYRIAKKTGKTQVVEFSDEEYAPYLAASMNDVFEVLGKKGS